MLSRLLRLFAEVPSVSYFLKLVEVPAIASKKLSDLTDSELLTRYLRDHDAAYFTVLYRRYAGKVFAKCISMLGDEGLARDATQDIFIKVLLNVARFTQLSSFSTWIYSITYNYCIDMIRKKKKMPVIFTEDMGREKQETGSDDEIPDSVLLDMEQTRLEKVFEALPPGDKAILLMKYIDDLSIKEIGTVLSKTESAIKMQIMRSKQRAQSIYTELFGNEVLE